MVCTTIQEAAKPLLEARFGLVHQVYWWCRAREREREREWEGGGEE
jgi:hypothetical protein